VERRDEIGMVVGGKVELKHNFEKVLDCLVINAFVRGV